MTDDLVKKIQLGSATVEQSTGLRLSDRWGGVGAAGENGACGGAVVVSFGSILFLPTSLSVCFLLSCADHSSLLLYLICPVWYLWLAVVTFDSRCLAGWLVFFLEFCCCCFVCPPPPPPPLSPPPPPLANVVSRLFDFYSNIIDASLARKMANMPRFSFLALHIQIYSWERLSQ